MAIDYKKEISDLIVSSSKLTGKLITTSDFEIAYQGLNHKPKSLPKGKVAVYTFLYNGQFLKIGQTSYNARYQSHHYHTKSGRSTLANSLVNDPKMPTVNTNNVNSWIKNNCERYDVLIDANKFSKDIKFVLNFIEGLLQYKYNPKYEK